MKKQVNLIIPFLVFFFISVSSLAFGYLFFIIYPAMGIPFETIFENIWTTFIIAFLTIVIASIILFKFLKPIEEIINSKDPEDVLTDNEKQIIIKNERRIKSLIVIMTILGFFIAPTAATFASTIRDGLLRWATIRFLIVSWSLGPAATFFLLLFFSYKMQKIKLAARLYEFTLDKKKSSIRKEVIATFLSFSLFIITILTCQAISRDEIVSGVSHVAFYNNKEAYEETTGYFSELLILCKNSSDPVVQKAARDIYNGWEKKAGESVLYTIFIGFMTFLFLVVCIVLYALDISSHLNAIKTKLKSIVKLDGDLTNLLVKTSSNEIGDIQVLFNALILNINKTLQRIFSSAKDIIITTKAEKQTVEMLLASNEEIKKTTQEVGNELAHQNDVTERTASVVNDLVEIIKENIDTITEQSSMVEESSAATIQMNASIQSVSEATKRASQLGDTLKVASQKGLDVTSEMYNSIDSISKSGVGINDIVSTIVAINEQTDLLAMNAAIEAAQAGAHGRGFAVVAEEMRKLSEDTTLQTREIESILNLMTGNINTSVSCSENLSITIHEMTQDISKTIDVIEEINNAAQEQLANSNQNTTIVQRLLDITRNIMDNLNHQSRLNEQLLATMTETEKSVERVADIGRKQEGYFRGLRIHFENFLNYFNQTRDKLDILEDMLESVRLIESDEVDHPDELM